MKPDPEHLKKLDEMRQKAEGANLQQYDDKDGGITSMLYALQGKNGISRFKNPLASIQLLEDVCGIDLLSIGESLPLTDLYKAVYVLDEGPEAIRHLIKAREKMRIIDRLHDDDLKKWAIGEMAEAETELIETAAAYYETNFAEADQAELANDLISSVGRVYSEFGQVNMIEKQTKSGVKSSEPWSLSIARLVADRLNVPVDEVLHDMNGERVIAIYNQVLMETGQATKPQSNKEKTEAFFAAVSDG